jgi:DNA-directed RNA polymerase specialized sigma24 family protein
MMKDWLLSDLSDNLEAYCRDVAQKAVQDYVQGILTVDALCVRILKEWVKISEREEYPLFAVLRRIAQRICSRELYEACRSADSELRNIAFRNVCIYLGRLLPHVRYAESLWAYTGAMEDVLQQTMETLQRKLCRTECQELRDPASFLKWAHVILIHQARVSLQSYERERECSSLDALPAAITEEWIDTTVRDPAERLVALELRQTLVKIISAMRNPRYRQVLLYSIAGLDEQEVARRLQASLQEIYLWRHRAVRTLRAKPEVIRMLRSLMDE